MVYEILIISALILLDLLLLKIMPKFYFSIGIPIYKGSVSINPNKTLKDIGVHLGISEGLVYKIKEDKLLFRTIFTYSTFYRIGFLSLIKGDISIRENKACITQRINLTIIYFLIFLAYIVITQKIDMFGQIFLAFILFLIVIFHLSRNAQIDNLKKEIEANINKEKEHKSRWGD